jgi:hypothetical protein
MRVLSDFGGLRGLCWFTAICLTCLIASGCDNETDDPPNACLQVDVIQLDCEEWLRISADAKCSSDDMTSDEDLEFRWDMGGAGDFSDWLPARDGGWGRGYYGLRLQPGLTSYQVVVEVRDSSGQTDRVEVEVDLDHGHHPRPDLIVSDVFVVDSDGNRVTEVSVGEQFSVVASYYCWETRESEFVWSYEVEYFRDDELLLTAPEATSSWRDLPCPHHSAAFQVDAPGKYKFSVSFGEPDGVTEYALYNNKDHVWLTVVAP